ncbi:hypothetical protein [Nocardia farcinica]|uniref:hypothetical protein n=1 Tax=Nocardia farcinica TaxID=37329 RepID=UPI0018933442|nr:hypothetical protein [Nocardia farcinica]MBF6374445.1 hypothetical protein [Nocardia farcinica]
MATATTHIEKVSGYVGEARCFRLDPPRVLDGVPREYVTICIQPRLGKLLPEVKVYAATEHGSSATPQLLRQPGSFTLGEEYSVEGCFFLALQLLGGYQIAVQ